MDPKSQVLLPNIFKAIQERHSTDIEVIGHTDTTGTSEFNQELGLKRAQAVAETLRSMGMNTANMSVASHGDRDLLVQTPKGVPEPKNRRVEVIVR
jgi:outer membrane protein OmpA-like peptidoglycan-associated protein